MDEIETETNNQSNLRLPPLGERRVNPIIDLEPLEIVSDRNLERMARTEENPTHVLNMSDLDSVNELNPLRPDSKQRDSKEQISEQDESTIIENIRNRAYIEDQNDLGDVTLEEI